MKNKNGEITSSQLVTIILLVVGFVILIFVFSTLLNEGEIDREVCHESVVLRGALPDKFNIKDIVSLKCQTAKFCITDKTLGKGDCKDEEGFEKGEYETIRVSSDKNKIEEDINRFVARELASCWAMMGQGKIQIFTRDINTKKSCSVCSRIAFDKDLKGKKDKIEGLGNYLLTREVPNQDVSYWNYLSNDVEGKIPSPDEFSTNERAIIFIEVGKSDWIEKINQILGTGVGTVLGVITGNPVKGIFLGYISGVALGKTFEGEITYRTGWAFIDYEKKDLGGLECSSFESIS